MKYGFRDDEIEYIWERIGGDNYLLSKIVERKVRGNDWREVIDMAMEQGLVEKKGAWSSYGERQLGQGRAGVKNFLKETSPKV
jgi:hypothetical protein